jgi:hypothetical protein
LWWAVRKNIGGVRMINPIVIPAVQRLSRKEIARLIIGWRKLYPRQDTFHKWRTSFAEKTEGVAFRLKVGLKVSLESVSLDVTVEKRRLA